jgi:hypothetical protein
LAAEQFPVAVIEPPNGVFEMPSPFFDPDSRTHPRFETNPVAPIDIPFTNYERLSPSGVGELGWGGAWGEEAPSSWTSTEGWTAGPPLLAPENDDPFRWDWAHW